MRATDDSQSISERSDLGSVVLDVDVSGRIISARGAAHALIGVNPHSLAGRELVSLVHPQERSGLQSLMQRLVEYGLSRRIDCRIASDGVRWRWAELSAVLDGDRMIMALQDATRARTAERDAREAQALVQALLANIPAAVSVRDPQGRLLSVNSEFARVAGDHPEILVGRSDTPFTTPFDSPDDDPRVIRQVLREGRPLEQDVIVTLPDGDVRTYSEIKFPVFGANGEPAAVGEIATDVTELRSAQHDSSEESFRLLTEHSLDVIARMRPNGTFSYVSPASRDVLGYEPEELMRIRPPAGRVHPEDEGVVADTISHVVVGGPAKTLSYRFLHGNGSWRWLETTWSCIRDDTATINRADPDDPDDEDVIEYELFAATRDVSDRYAAQQQLEQLALRDGLTGLANRALLSDRLTTAIERLERRGGAVAVYLIDLDHFKAINDTFGHAGGDAVIVEAGRRLVRASRAGDTVARLAATS